MRRQGHGGDHVCIASEHRLRKKAEIYLSPCRTRAEARTALVEYTAVFCNRQRVPSALRYRTPQDMAAALTA